MTLFITFTLEMWYNYLEVLYTRTFTIHINWNGTMLELKPMIHKFRMKDNYYCLDVNSGIIHVIDELIDKSIRYI